MTKNNQPSNPRFVKSICDRIAECPGQRITFSNYMDWVLYDLKDGYYATNEVDIGVRGDFFTAPHLGPDFGELLAEQFLEMWQILGCPPSFQLVEMGAGQGLIAMDILRYLQGYMQSDSQGVYAKFWAALDYIIVEKAAALVAEQQYHLQGFNQEGQKVRWLALDDVPVGSITGCIFSNELLDALPVHRVIFAGGKLQEVYVTLGADQALLETVADLSTPQLAEYLQEQGIDLGDGYPDGYRTEINLRALDWLETVASKLKQGYVLTIDYGYTAAQYYSPGRPLGTLQCYRNHAHHSDPYVYVGEQDITAHVNFTALERWGTQVGLETMGRTQQGPFLMALGLGNRLVANNTRENLAELSEILRRREALHGLMNPLGLGGFQVLVQSKKITEKQSLQGIRGLKMEGLEV